jgi:hypothetical protein
LKGFGDGGEVTRVDIVMSIGQEPPAHAGSAWRIWARLSAGIQSELFRLS